MHRYVKTYFLLDSDIYFSWSASLNHFYKSIYITCLFSDKFRMSIPEDEEIMDLLATSSNESESGEEDEEMNEPEREAHRDEVVAGSSTTTKKSREAHRKEVVAGSSTTTKNS